MADETAAEPGIAALFLKVIDTLQTLSRAQNAEMDRQSAVIGGLISVVELQTRRLDALQRKVAGLLDEEQPAANVQMH